MTTILNGGFINLKDTAGELIPYVNIKVGDLIKVTWKDAEPQWVVLMGFRKLKGGQNVRVYPLVMDPLSRGRHGTYEYELDDPDQVVAFRENPIDWKQILLVD